MAKRTNAVVVADLPFGCYEVAVGQAVAMGVRLLKKGLPHAVTIECGSYYTGTVPDTVQAGVPPWKSPLSASWPVSRGPGRCCCDRTRNGLRSGEMATFVKQ